MSDHIIDTPFGPAQVRVHRTAAGWLAMLVGQHLVPYPPPLPSRAADSEAEALVQIQDAVRSVAVGS